MKALRLLLLLTFGVALYAVNCFAGDYGSEHHAEYDLLTPAPRQFDIEASDTWQFLDDNSAARRRVDSSLDSTIRLGPDLGTTQLQAPEVLISYWFDSVNAAQFQFRDFSMYGDHFSTTPFFYGGGFIPKNQILNNDGTRWYTFGGFYERRLTPLYENREWQMPQFLKGWDLRAKIGVEFTYNDFRINDGLPAKLRHSPFLTRVRMQERGLPYPVIGLEARRWLIPHVAIEATAQGYWFNKWDSGRDEGGTVYDSQSGFETHLRVIYSNSRLRGFSPFVGVNYNYSKYTQTSSGVFNMVRVQMIGPELGFNFSFNPWR
ncbi:MAG: hypothetical protein Q7S58_03085 [Candidatus Binatus sp.]|uniref:hypothetical protein n=1 Tax=Candidatus Binatus sp. TaxID=2811406 RepID=UPI0027163755|nr:hypothetical protein [Candidatus Binatus sp.]MDO8431373.1 hypothetical protein [Candidatus Binatus sp.]